MKATIERNTLLAALARAKTVIERRNSIPILSNVLVGASDAGVCIMSTDMEVSLFETLPAEITRQGGTTAPVHAFHDIVKETPKGCQIEIEATEQDGVESLIIRAGRLTFTLPGLPFADYPEMKKAKMPVRFTLGSTELHGLFKPTRHAISTEETRYYLCGALLAIEASNGGTVLRAIACDGHRLAYSQIAMPKGAENLASSIIPTKAVNILYRLAGKYDGKIKVKASDKRISFSLGKIIFTVKFIDGTYPDYERIIPTENNTKMTADRASLAAVVKRIGKITTPQSRGLKLSLARNSLTLSKSSCDLGTASEEIEVDYQGNPFEVGFNARYLADILGAITGDEVEFAMSDPASPTVVRDSANASVLYILMPTRV